MNNDEYNNIETGYYDKIYKHGKGVQYNWHKLKFSGILKILSELNYDKLLDIACGPGTFISLLPDNKECTGIDIAKTQIEYANNINKSGKHKFIISDVLDLPFDDNSFDIVTSVEFIEHITKEAGNKMLSEIKRCLKPNGYLLLTTPNFNSTWIILEKIVSVISKVDYTKQHITRYKKNILNDFLNSNGFEVDFIKSYLLFSPFIGVISSKLAEKLFQFEFKNIKTGNLLLALAKNKK